MVALAVMLVMLAGGAYWGYRMFVTGQKDILPEPCVTLSLTELRPENVVVRIYNGGTERGLAGSVAKTLKAGGFIVTTTDNTDEAVYGTIVVGANLDAPEVQLVASWFETPTLREDGREDRTVDVLVGEAGAPMTQQHLSSVTIPSGKACVPALASPTPTPTPEEVPQ
jgi:hypothetical protein